jgi:hypothetical protein
MHTFISRESSSRKKLPKYVREYFRIKNRCKFQKNFSSFLLVIFFVLQYSVPIFLVVLGSVASSREQLAIFISPNTKSDTDSGKLTDSSSIISRIIYLIGLITILLGVINNIVRPPESYDIAANYNNKFFKFEQNFDLQFIEISDLSGEFDNSKDAVGLIVKFLITKNDELCQLIQEYNDARSLTPRQMHLKGLNKDDSEIAEPIPITKPDENKVSLSNSSITSTPETQSESDSQQANNSHALDRTKIIGCD